jgi:hypothetical protein
MYRLLRRLRARGLGVDGGQNRAALVPGLVARGACLFLDAHLCCLSPSEPGVGLVSSQPRCWERQRCRIDERARARSRKRGRAAEAVLAARAVRWDTMEMNGWPSQLRPNGYLGSEAGGEVVLGGKSKSAMVTRDGSRSVGMSAINWVAVRW